jgi:hypothetical protein
MSIKQAFVVVEPPSTPRIYSLPAITFVFEEGR